MKQRCHNTNCRAYRFYGAIGIAVCDEWMEFGPFRDWAISSGYADDLEIDRIDGARGYCPENCRWVTADVNRRNKRRSLILDAFGELKTISEWSEDARCVVNRRTLRTRVMRGWAHQDAITTPLIIGGKRDSVRRKDATLIEAFNEVKTILDWEKDPRVSVLATTIATRMGRGWTPKQAVETPASYDRRHKRKVAHAS